MKHLILTPFSFNHPNPRDEEWMEKRWQIFMDVTYPSITHQTCMNFEWIVGFHNRTSAIWKQKITSTKGFEPIFGAYHNKIWRDICRGYANKKYLLTTRVDSDDALAQTAVQNMQAVLKNNMRPHIENFSLGLITDGKLLYYMKQKSNNFISMLELSEGADSVRGGLYHTNAKSLPHYHSTDNTLPLWLIYVHSGVGHNITWTMKWAKEHPTCVILHKPVTKKDFDSFHTNLKFEDMHYEDPN